MFFDAQQSFISIYTNNYPKYSSCTQSSDICKLSRSSWSYELGHTPFKHNQCASTFITSLPQSSFFIGFFFALLFLQH